MNPVFKKMLIANQELLGKIGTCVEKTGIITVKQNTGIPSGSYCLFTSITVD